MPKYVTSGSFDITHVADDLSDAEDQMTTLVATMAMSIEGMAVVEQSSMGASVEAEDLPDRLLLNDLAENQTDDQE